MPKPSSDSTLTNTNARLTADKGVGFDAFTREKILYLYDEKGKVKGVDCKNFHELTDGVLLLDKPATHGLYLKELERQYRVLYAGLISLRYTSTTCLLKAASALHQLLTLSLAAADEKKVRTIAGSLLELFEEVAKRTKKPYQFAITFNDLDLYKPLAPDILAQHPLNQQLFWKQSLHWKKATSASIKNKPVNDGLIPIIEKEIPPANAKDIEDAIATAEANIKINGELAALPVSDTPLVDRYRSNLTKINLEDVYRQTNFRARSGDWKLSDLVEVIFYASAMTIVLDKNGQPFEKDGFLGLFPYGMLLSSRKFKTVKLLPPPGKYVSLGPLAGQQFVIEGAVVKKLPIQYSGIIGFKEHDVTGSWPADYQEKANEVLGRNKVYIGSLVVSGAFGSKDIGITDMVPALPEIVVETMPYFFEVIKKKITSWFDNYADLLKEIAKEVLKNLVVEALKKIAVKFIVKQIGKRVIPGINILAAAKDAVDAIRGLDNDTIAIAINCIRLYLKAGNQDDKTLSMKILANIMGDEFESEIKSAIIKHATKAGIKVANKVKGKVSKPEATQKTEGKNKPVSPGVDHENPAKETGQNQAPAANAKPGDDKTEAAKKTGTDDAEAIRKGMKAFEETSKAQAAEKEKERGTSNKDNKRPETEKSPKEENKSSPAQAEEKKKAASDRLAKIKKRARALNKKKAADARKTEDKKTDDTKTEPNKFDPKTSIDDTSNRGKKARANAARKMARTQAKNEAQESLNSGNPTPQALYLAERLEALHGREAVEKFKKTGKLPRGFEFSHFFSLSEYPEFGHKGEHGLITDHDDHIQNHHGNNTREPLHGYPKIPGDDGDNDNDHGPNPPKEKTPIPYEDERNDQDDEDD